MCECVYVHVWMMEDAVVEEGLAMEQPPGMWVSPSQSAEVSLKHITHYFLDRDHNTGS